MFFKFYLDDTILKKISKLFPLPSLTPLGIAVRDVMNVTYNPSFPCSADCCLAKIPTKGSPCAVSHSY